MSVDIKKSVAYLTESGWTLDTPEENIIKAKVIVKVKQKFVDSYWLVSVLRVDKFADDETINQLYKKYGSEPSGELDW